MKPSRRILLKSCAALVFAGWAADAALAQSKASKKAMQPGAPGGCKVVEGPISPNGWCVAFVKKA